MTFPVSFSFALGGSLKRLNRTPNPEVPDPGDPDPPPPPPPPPNGTIYGYNYNSDTSFQTIAGRKAKFGGRNPCPRIYTGSNGHPTSFSAAVADEKRVSWSFKAGGGQSTSYLASTAARDDRYVPWLLDIPNGWEVFWTYHHEPNSATGFELPVADFRGTYTRMLQAKAQVQSTLNSRNVVVHVTANLMAYQVGVGIWSNQWVPDCDILTWDSYHNPGNFTSSTGSNKYGAATGNRYGSTYALPAQRFAPMFKVTQDTGYAASWGILELNGPMRDWDRNEAGRVAVHRDTLNMFADGGGMTGGAAPKVVLLWEAPSGVNWVQGFGYNDSRALNASWDGGAIPYSQARADASPMWAFWRPYITGTPRRG